MSCPNHTPVPSVLNHSVGNTFAPEVEARELSPAHLHPSNDSRAWPASLVAEVASMTADDGPTDEDAESMYADFLKAAAARSTTRGYPCDGCGRKTWKLTAPAGTDKMYCAHCAPAVVA